MCDEEKEDDKKFWETLKEGDRFTLQVFYPKGWSVGYKDPNIFYNEFHLFVKKRTPKRIIADNGWLFESGKIHGNRPPEIPYYGCSVNIVPFVDVDQSRVDLLSNRMMREKKCRSID